MPTNILFAAKAERWDDYKEHLRAAFQEHGIDAILSTDLLPKDVDFIVYAPNSDVQDFSVFPNLKAVLNLWAGVETVVGNPILTVPLARMVDPSLTQGMVEWVTGHVLRHHLGMDAHIMGTPGIWAPKAPPVAWGRKVTVLGLGELGLACAQSLARIGFDVHGWARRAQSHVGLTCHHGAGGLKGALSGAEFVILLLPDTPNTENTLNGETLSRLAKDACVINPGRGPLLDDEAMIKALDSGQIGHATLDVFRIEPLPRDHPYWHHPKVTVTPHIASETRPKWSAQTIATNIRRHLDGEPLLHVVDREAGY